MRLFELSEFFRVSHARLAALATVAGLPVQDDYPEDSSLDLIVLLILDDVLARVASGDPDVRMLILQRVWPETAAHFAVLRKFLQAGASNLPPFRLGLADQRYCTWPTSRSGFLDLQSVNWIEQLPSLPLETWSLDCNALYVRAQHTLHQRKDLDGARQPGTAA